MARRPPAPPPRASKPPRPSAKPGHTRPPGAATRAAGKRGAGAEASTPTDTRAAAGPTPLPSVRPDVLVDFHLDRGLLHVVLRNIGGASAYTVTTRFDRPFHGLGGRKDMTTLALFRSVPFLAPGRQLVQLVDSMHAYVSRKEPIRLTATITYADREGNGYKETIPHDLAIYRELAEANTT